MQNLDERDEIIIEAAVDEFAHSGFHNANMEAIANVAGVGKGTLYRRFKSKQHLFFSIFKKGFDDFIKVVKQINPELSVMEQIEEYCDVFIRVFRKSSNIIKLFIHEQSKILEGIDEDLLPFIHQTNDTLTEFWINMVKKWQEENPAAEKKDPEYLGIILSFMFRAVYMMPVSIYGDESITDESIQKLKEYFLDILFNGAFTIKTL